MPFSPLLKLHVQNSSPEIPSSATYSQLEANDLKPMVDAMVRVNLSVFRVRSKAMYEAICIDSFRRPEVLIAVAKVDGSLAGFVVNVLDWAKFTSSFPRRHPFLAPAIFSARFLNKSVPPSRDSSIGRFLGTVPNNAKWTDSSPKIAKVVCIGVGDTYQGRGIGPGLYRYMFELLAAKGVTRYDARLEYDNIASARLHQKTGWAMVAAGPTVFATIALPTEE